VRFEVFHKADDERRVDYAIDIDVSEDHPISSFRTKAAFGQTIIWVM
jgi:hypothetical protein